MRVVFVSYRITEYIENQNRYDSGPRFSSDSTEYSENQNRYDSSPRFPSDTLNTIEIRIQIQQWEEVFGRGDGDVALRILWLASSVSDKVNSSKLSIDQFVFIRFIIEGKMSSKCDALDSQV